MQPRISIPRASIPLKRTLSSQYLQPSEQEQGKSKKRKKKQDPVLQLPARMTQAEQGRWERGVWVADEVPTEGKGEESAESRVSPALDLLAAHTDLRAKQQHNRGKPLKLPFRHKTMFLSRRSRRVISLNALLRDAAPRSRLDAAHLLALIARLGQRENNLMLKRIIDKPAQSDSAVTLLLSNLVS